MNDNTKKPNGKQTKQKPADKNVLKPMQSRCTLRVPMEEWSKFFKKGLPDVAIVAGRVANNNDLIVTYLEEVKL